jgi:hypothetical protein
MKSLFIALILTLAFGGLVQARAQTAQKISVSVGKQKKATRSKITVKFVSLIEDSRCPDDANCIQAGNARIKVHVSKAGSKPATLEMNTNLGEKGNIYEGYAIYLTDLTPTPKANVRLNRNAYTATFSISRLSR